MVGRVDWKEWVYTLRHGRIARRMGSLGNARILLFRRMTGPFRISSVHFRSIDCSLCFQVQYTFLPLHPRESRSRYAHSPPSNTRPSDARTIYNILLRSLLPTRSTTYSRSWLRMAQTGFRRRRSELASWDLASQFTGQS